MMQESLHNKRQNYAKSELIEENLKTNPIEMFRDWYFEAENNDMIAEANAMSISTVENEKTPRTRMVLLKEYTWEGFIFYTNYLSRKGKALDENTAICLHFFWPPLERQICINAHVEKVADNLSEGYFASRPRGSQLGAWASQQSTVVPNRFFLENELKEYEKKFENHEIPKPDFWGGYIAKPYEIEFWQGRPNRLHDRILYTLQPDYEWRIERLAP